jgi:hypothetical protein
MDIRRRIRTTRLNKSIMAIREVEGGCRRRQIVVEVRLQCNGRSRRMGVDLAMTSELLGQTEDMQMMDNLWDLEEGVGLVQWTALI